MVAAAVPALVSGNLFSSHPLVYEVPRRSPAVQHFIADFFGKDRRSHKWAAFLFHGRRGAFFNWKIKIKMKCNLRLFFFFSPCVNWRISESSQSPYLEPLSALLQVSEQQRECLSASAYYSSHSLTKGEAYISGFPSLCRDSAVCYWAYSEEILSCLLKGFFPQTKQSGSGQCHLYSCHVL